MSEPCSAPSSSPRPCAANAIAIGLLLRGDTEYPIPMRMYSAEAMILSLVIACGSGGSDSTGDAGTSSSSSSSSSGASSSNAPIDCGGTSCTTYCFTLACGGGVVSEAGAGPCPETKVCGELATGCTPDGGDSFVHQCPMSSSSYYCNGVDREHRTVQCWFQ